MADTTISAKERRMQKLKSRVWELDALRGLAILLVVWDHTMFDMGSAFYYQWISSGSEFLCGLAEFARSYLNSELRVYGWPVFVFIFFLVSGTCTSFSKSNLIRGIKLAIVAVLISVVTYYAQEEFGLGEVFILFGVLHCMSVCILFYAIIELILRLIFGKSKGYNYIRGGVMLALAIAFLVISYTYNVTLVEVARDSIGVTATSEWTGLFFFVKGKWWTADYFPIFPFIGFFMLGAGLSAFLYPKKKSLLPKLDGKWNAFLTYPGRHSLFIYVAGQVIMLGLCALLTYIVTGTFY
jgi:uncharacterized membrane protein